MIIIENVIIRQGRRGLYFYDSNQNLYSVDLSFANTPSNFVIGSSTVTISCKLTRSNFDNVFASAIVKELSVIAD